jgi:hypothetical protein
MGVGVTVEIKFGSRSESEILNILKEKTEKRRRRSISVVALRTCVKIKKK